MRRREVKQHDSRYALLKNKANRTAHQEHIFQAIQQLNLQVSIAWRLREDFKTHLSMSLFRGCKKIKLWLISVNEEAVKEVSKKASVLRFAMPEQSAATASSQDNQNYWKRIQKVQKLPKRTPLFPWRLRPPPTMFTVVPSFLCGRLRPRLEI